MAAANPEKSTGTPSVAFLSSTLSGRYSAVNFTVLQKHPRLVTLLDTHIHENQDIQNVHKLFAFFKERRTLTDSLSADKNVDAILRLKADSVYKALFFIPDGKSHKPKPKLSAYLEIVKYIQNKCKISDINRIRDLLKPELRQHLAQGRPSFDVSHISPHSATPDSATPATNPFKELRAPKFTPPPPISVSIPDNLVDFATTPRSRPTRSKLTQPPEPVQPEAVLAEEPASPGNTPQQPAADTSPSAEVPTPGETEGGDDNSGASGNGDPGDNGGQGSGGDQGGNGGQQPTPDPEDDETSSTSSSMAVVPDYEPAHCDADAQPGTEPKNLDGYFYQTIDGKADWAAKGAAVYLTETPKTRSEVTVLLLELVPCWTMARVHLNTLEIKQVQSPSDEVPDLNNLTTDEKADIDIVRKHHLQLKTAMAQITAIKDSLLPFCKNSSIAPCAQFFKTLLLPLETTLLFAQVFLQKHRGAEASTLDASSLNLSQAPDLQTSSLSSTQNQSAMPAQFNLTVGGAKLPKLDMKTFSGKSEDYLRWKEDWTNYFSKWQNRVDDYTMFAYLGQSMPAHYKKELNSYPYTKASYDTWMSELDRRHGDQTHLVLTYRNNLKQLPNTKDNLGSFANFRLRINETIRGMELVKINSSKDGSEWLSYLLPKITDTQRTNWQMYKQQVEFSTPDQFKRVALFQHFVTWMERYERELRDTNLMMALANPKGSNPRHNNNGNNPKATTHVAVAQSTTPASPAPAPAPAKASPAKPATATTNAGTAKSGSKRKSGGNSAQAAAPAAYKSERPKSCCFCKQKSHHPTQCAQDLDRKKMWSQVFDSSLCYCCLNLGHRPQTCQNKKKCPKKGPDNKPCTHFHSPILHDAVYTTVSQWEASKKK